MSAVTPTPINTPTRVVPSEEPPPTRLTTGLKLPVAMAPLRSRGLQTCETGRRRGSGRVSFCRCAYVCVRVCVYVYVRVLGCLSARGVAWYPVDCVCMLRPTLATGTAAPRHQNESAAPSGAGFNIERVCMLCGPLNCCGVDGECDEATKTERPGGAARPLGIHGGGSRRRVRGAPRAGSAACRERRVQAEAPCAPVRAGGSAACVGVAELSESEMLVRAYAAV